MAPFLMRAAVAKGRESIALERVPIPEPGRGEVRIQVHACGVCGSDLHMYHLGLWSPGLIPGHELFGVVDTVGDGVTRVGAGDRVVVEPLKPCGRCAYCGAGRESICPELKLVGIHENGGFAEYVVVPERRVFVVPSDLPPRIAALAEPMAVVVHGLYRGAFQPGQRVLVLGAGALGLLAALAARSLGASDVLLVARHPHQAALGKLLGATVLGEAEATPEALGARGKATPIDLVIETVGGRADTLRPAGHAIRPGGTVCVLGVFTGSVKLDPYPFFMKEGNLVWSNCYAHGDKQADFDEAVTLLGRHREVLSSVTTHTVSLDEIASAYVLAGDKKAGAVKVTVVP
jgi:2-desacetyl-2-hydroxyethyl bacteriochlorophyllide A dehydrogenase